MSDCDSRPFCDDAREEGNRMRADMQRIWDICHIPTKKTRHEKAYTHFAADFSQIREITKRWIEP